ncbi:MAG: thiamine biosynthesis protein ThiS [Thermodesulfovibrio sp.]|nr:thiamine biosynthesis protein ThiS [Thermodesulfovibrio sp.]
MKLTINGETVENIKAQTVSELLAELNIVQGRVAVEVNLSVIKRAEHEAFQLKDGDVVEIVNFVGGG